MSLVLACWRVKVSTFFVFPPVVESAVDSASEFFRAAFVFLTSELNFESSFCLSLIFDCSLSNCSGRFFASAFLWLHRMAT